MAAAKEGRGLWGGEHVDGLAGGFGFDGEGLVGPLAGGFVWIMGWVL